MTVFPQGTLIRANISERLLSTIKLRENRRDSFDPQRENLLGEDNICMANLLEIPEVIFFFLITSLTSLGCFRREVLFCQASMKIKMSPLSVHC